MPFFIVEQASVEPVSLDELRAQCRVDSDITDENSLLESFISSAREFCEEHTGRVFAPKKIGYSGRFPAGKILELKPDLVGVESIKYCSSAGDEITFNDADYFVDKASLYGAAVVFSSWPSTKANHPQPVTILFNCGNEECSKSVKQAILLLSHFWYENRGAKASKEVMDSVTALLSGSRVQKI